MIDEPKPEKRFRQASLDEFRTESQHKQTEEPKKQKSIQVSLDMYFEDTANRKETEQDKKWRQEILNELVEEETKHNRVSMFEKFPNLSKEIYWLTKSSEYGYNEELRRLTRLKMSVFAQLIELMLNKRTEEMTENELNEVKGFATRFVISAIDNYKRGKEKEFPHKWQAFSSIIRLAESSFYDSFFKNLKASTVEEQKLREELYNKPHKRALFMILFYYYSNVCYRNGRLPEFEKFFKHYPELLDSLKFVRRNEESFEKFRERLADFISKTSLDKNKLAKLKK